MAIEHYLVTVAGTPLHLDANRHYVFGRDRAADLRIPDALTSRRHAELRWSGTGWSLRDLGSRNGTLVSGERVDGDRALADGDRIQIGGQVLTYHVLPGGTDPETLRAEAGTFSDQETFEQAVDINALAHAGASYSGELRDGLFDLLQFFQMTRKSGRIDLPDGGAIHTIFVEEGGVVHAQRDALSGMDALVALAKRPPERFAFHRDVAAPPWERSVEGNAQGTLMELARLVDEAP